MSLAPSPSPSKPAATSVPRPAPPPPAVPPLPVRRFTVDEYHRMIRSGILGEDDDVELLEGWIIPKMPRNPEHDAVISYLHNRVFGPRLPAGWSCRSQSAISATESEPEPDLAVVRGSDLDYLDRHPGPADMALVIEVAESSLAHDRTIKQRIYAAASVPAYWIVNLVDRTVEVYTEPSGPAEAPAYARRDDFAADSDAAVVPVVDGVALPPVPVREFLR